MKANRYPWSIVVFAAICVIGELFLGYYVLFGIASDGLSLEDKSGSVIVTEVDPRTPGATAGL